MGSFGAGAVGVGASGDMAGNAGGGDMAGSAGGGCTGTAAGATGVSIGVTTT